MFNQGGGRARSQPKILGAFLWLDGRGQLRTEKPAELWPGRLTASLGRPYQECEMHWGLNSCWYKLCPLKVKTPTSWKTNWVKKIKMWIKRTNVTAGVFKYDNTYCAKHKTYQNNICFNSKADRARLQMTHCWASCLAVAGSWGPHEEVEHQVSAGTDPLCLWHGPERLSKSWIINTQSWGKTRRLPGSQKTSSVFRNHFTWEIWPLRSCRTGNLMMQR